MRDKSNAEIEYCTRCGKPVYRPPCHRKGRPFCSRQCHMKTLNEEMNPGRMTPAVREKLRATHLGTGKQEGYPKKYGRHEHRIVAEEMLGRPLQPGEVVHHIDGNKHNNATENLMVFSNQAAHARWHAEHDGDWGSEKEGGAK